MVIATSDGKIYESETHQAVEQPMEHNIDLAEQPVQVAEKSITNIGIDRYNLELRRSPTDGTFRPPGSMDDNWQNFTTPMRDLPKIIDPRKKSDSGEFQVAGWLGDLFGYSDEKKAELAPRLSKYPSSDDVEFAKTSGFFNDINERWSTGKVARVFKDSVLGKYSDELPDEKLSKLIEGNPQLAEVYAKGALVTNRIPIAAVGFNPDKTNLESTLKNLTLGGSYSKDKDRMFAIAAEPSSIVHESIHRGIEHLRKEYPEEMKKLERDLPSEESTVRYLMLTQAGNPEKDEGLGKIGEKQQTAAAYSFDKSIRSDAYTKSLEKLTNLAQRYIKENRPSEGARR